MSSFNARRCVEQALPIVITWKMYEGMLQAAEKEYGEPRTDGEQYVALLLKEACQEPLDPLKRPDGKPTLEWFNMTKRIEREVAETLRHNRAGTTAKQFIMCIRLIQHILDEGKMYLISGSKFAEAMDIITETLLTKLEEHSHRQDQHDRMEESATKAARKMYSRLKARGLYV